VQRLSHAGEDGGVLLVRQRFEGAGGLVDGQGRPSLLGVDDAVQQPGLAGGRQAAVRSSTLVARKAFPRQQSMAPSRSSESP